MDEEFTTKYAAWVGTPDDHGWRIAPGDMLYTDSLDEARAWKASEEVPQLALGQTLGISDRHGVMSTITRTLTRYEVWVR
jgi:hypothetical protein